jgi:hypothetical protein
MLYDPNGRPIEAPIAEQFGSDALPHAYARRVVEAAMDSGMVDLMREEQGWLRSAASGVLSEADRVLTTKRANWYFVKDGSSKQTILLWVNYTVGSGATLAIKERAEDEGEPPEKPAGKAGRFGGEALDGAVATNADAVRAHWYAPANECWYGMAGQRRHCAALRVNGEIFVQIWGTGPEAKVRTIPPGEIVEIVCNPDDAEEPCWYIRQMPVGSESEIIAYPSLCLELLDDRRVWK